MVTGPGEIPDSLIAPIVQAPSAPINTQPSRRTEPEADRSVQAPDTVELSPQAREVRSLTQTAQSVPEVRPQAVQQAQVAAPVRENTEVERNVPAAKVAEKLLLEG